MKPPHQLNLHNDPRYRRVIKNLETLRSRDLMTRLLPGLGRILIFLLLIIGLRCLLDYWLHFNLSSRTALLALDVIIAGWIAWRYLLYPLKHRLDRDRMALRLQEYAPELRSQVIATIQLVPMADMGRASISLVERLLKLTHNTMAELNWKGAISLKSSALWLLLTALIGSGFAGWVFTYPKASSILIDRYFLSSRPPLFDTQIEVLTGDAMVARGDRLELQAELSGKIPQDVTFILESSSGSAEEIRVSSSKSAPNIFSLALENLQKSFTYKIYGGDASTSEYKVKVIDAPVLQDLRINVTPPAYTGISPYEVSVDQLRLEEGAELSLIAEATEKLSQAAVHFYLNSTKENLAEGLTNIKKNLTVNGVQVYGELGVLDTSISQMLVHMKGLQGVESINDVRHKIAWKIDKAPEIMIELHPKDGTSIVTGRSLTIEGVVLEDYGLSDAYFKWVLANSDVSYTVPLHVDQSGIFNSSFVFGQSRNGSDSEWLKSESGDTFEWWIEVVDNSQLARGPQRAKTSRKRIRIVTPEEKIAELMTLVRENVSTIKNAGERQKDANEQLRQLIEQKNLPGNVSPEKSTKP